MLSDNIAIVGCGRVGSNLAIILAKEHVKNLTIFDPDIITENKRSSPPYKKEYKNCYKVDVLRFLIKQHSYNATKVTTSIDTINRPLSKKFFVIDCRDRKNYINSNLEISIDGSILHLNSIDNYRQIIDKPDKYMYEKNDLYLHYSMNIILNYLKNKDYLLHEYRDYDIIKNTYYVVNIFN